MTRLVIHFPFFHLTEKQRLLKHQSITMEMLTPRSPRPKSAPRTLDRITRKSHMLSIETDIVYLASPAALRKFGSVNDIG